MAQAQVISYLRRRDKTQANGFENYITWLGAEQRFVAPIRNSNVNNLEEQYVLGTDKYITSYDDERGHHTQTCFCTGDPQNSSDYYYLETIQYPPDASKANYGFDGTKFYIPSNTDEISFEDTTLKEKKQGVFNFDENGQLTVYPSNVTIIQEDWLYFVKDPSPDVPNIKVWKKTTGKKRDANGRQVIQEIIETFN